MNFVKRFARDRSGATAIEYGLIGALISLAIIVVLQMMGIGDIFSLLANTIGAANSAAGV